MGIAAASPSSCLPDSMPADAEAGEASMKGRDSDGEQRTQQEAARRSLARGSGSQRGQGQWRLLSLRQAIHARR